MWRRRSSNLEEEEEFEPCKLTATFPNKCVPGCRCAAAPQGPAGAAALRPDPSQNTAHGERAACATPKAKRLDPSQKVYHGLVRRLWFCWFILNTLLSQKIQLTVSARLAQNQKRKGRTQAYSSFKKRSPSTIALARADTQGGLTSRSL